jgi:hypothetical protein
MTGVTHFYGLFVVVMFPVLPNFIFSRNSVPFRTSEWAIPRHTRSAEDALFPRNNENLSEHIPRNFFGISMATLLWPFLWFVG